MLKPLVHKSVVVAGGILTLAVSLSCTKKPSEKNRAAPTKTPSQPSAATPSATPNSGQVEAAQTLFALQSIAGDLIFCQTFSTPSSFTQLADVEYTVNGIAGAQAGIPAGMLNPFTVQSLGLSVKDKGCNRVPELLGGGHCALTVQKQTASGVLSFTTEQRLLWKDIPTLAQAANVKTSLDAKTALLSSKNAVMLSLNRQLTQQRQLLQILQATTGQSGLLADAQALLESLQEQVATLESEIRGLESEIKPIQDEMNKRIDELNTARAALKLGCNPGAMGATAATWKEQ